MSQPSRSRRPEDSAILVNKLTVGDARDLLRSEGGPISVGRIAWRFITIVAVAAFTARAIVLGKATAWHLFLPMVGEYLVLLLSVPVLALILKDEGLRKDAKRSCLWLVVFAAAGAFWITYRSLDENVGWIPAAKSEATRLFTWITTHQMHWPILGAMTALVAGLPGRVAAFHRHGPPFMAAGLGCVMRLVIPILGCFLLPFLLEGSFPIVWVIWTVLLVAELTAIWMHWDLQHRLAKRGIKL